jgi:hypothetical protein
VAAVTDFWRGVVFALVLFGALVAGLMLGDVIVPASNGGNQ